MKKTTVFFDLDGTLLPMNQDEFVGGYLKFLAQKLLPHGYDGEKLVKGIWQGVSSMVKNDGKQTNEEAFWKTFVTLFGQKVLDDKPLFEDFYANDFVKAKQFCGFNPLAEKAVEKIRKMGFRVALATNPLFPAVATEHRIRWAGLDVSDFELYTTYENSCFCKPSLGYYDELTQKLSLKPEECIMVGNDVSEDMVARKRGFDVFLLTDCLINKTNEDISSFPNGSFDELIEYMEKVNK